MAQLEKIVRPFQLPAATPPRRVITGDVVGDKDAVLRIGRGGSGRTFSGSYNSQISSYVDSHQNEI